MKILGKLIHGSKLYGLDGPGSDTDYKSVHLPEVRDCLLCRAPHNIQSKDEMGKKEYQSISLQTFLNHCRSGQDIAITTLHAPNNKIIEDTYLFKYLRDNRHKFHTKRMIGQISYAKSQKYKI